MDGGVGGHSAFPDSLTCCTLQICFKSHETLFQCSRSVCHPRFSLTPVSHTSETRNRLLIDNAMANTADIGLHPRVIQLTQ